MGYSVNTMAFFQMMHNKGLFENVKRVVDLGSQEMHFSERDKVSYSHRECVFYQICRDKSSTMRRILRESLGRIIIDP